MLAKNMAYPIGSDAERYVRTELQHMVLNDSFNTTSSYVPVSVKYPDGLISFVDRHMRYLNANPKLDAWMYIANLRLKTRARQ